MSDKISDEAPDLENPDKGSVVQHIGKYQVLGLLGRGSTGAVYLGLDPQLQRKVAIKVLHTARTGVGDSSSSFQASKVIVKRFLSEAQSTAKLKHQNIIALHEGNAHGPAPFLVMEYVEGSTLDAMIKSGKRFPIPELLLILRQLSDAIDYAHSQGVLHRDIKPANILIDSKNKPYILDFGVAKIHEQISAEDEGVRTTSVLGTPAYMSPEQIRNKPLNNQSDLFAFAIVAFQCLCGLRPFDGETFTAVAASIIEKAPRKALSFRPDLSNSVDTVFARALAKDRAERFGSAREFINALEVALNSPSAASSAAVYSAVSSAVVRTNNATELVSAVEIAKDIDTVRGLANQAVAAHPDKADALSSLNSTAHKSESGVRPKAPVAQNRIIKEKSSLFLIIFFLGLVIGTGCIGAYFFWPRRTVVYIAGQGPALKNEGLALSNTAPATQQNIKILDPEALSEFGDRTAVGLEVKVREEEISEKLIQEISREANDSERIPQLVSELKERTKLPYRLNVTSLLSHRSYLVKIAAIKILIDQKAFSEIKEIVPLLDDHDPLVRGFAAKAMGVLAKKEYSKILGQKASQEQVPEVIRALENAIDRIGEREL